MDTIPTIPIFSPDSGGVDHVPVDTLVDRHHVNPDGLEAPVILLPVPPRSIDRLTDFIPPYSNGLCKEVLGPFDDDVLKGSRVLWVQDKVDTQFVTWIKIACSPENGYLSVEKVDQLKQFDKLKHKGVVVQGDQVTKWPEKHFLDFIFTGTSWESKDKDNMTPKDVPRIVVSVKSPKEVLGDMMVWGSGLAELWEPRSIVKMNPETDPGRIRLRYRSKLTKKMVTVNLGQWSNLATLLAETEEKKAKEALSTVSPWPPGTTFDMIVNPSSLDDDLLSSLLSRPLLNPWLFLYSSSPLSLSTPPAYYGIITVETGSAGEVKSVKWKQYPGMMWNGRGPMVSGMTQDR